MKTVVLLSGGLDSAVNFKSAIDQSQVKLALTFDYGQAAFVNEREAAARCAERYGVPHRVVELTWYRDLLPGPLAGRGEVRCWGGRLTPEAPRHLEEAWVPNRNCVFLSIGAAFAESLGADGVVIGLNREEAEIFPDNSRIFEERMNTVLSISTLSGVRAVTYTGDLTKAEIVSLGLRIGAPLDVIYSCYRRSGDQRMCGSCQSCLRLKAALADNDHLDNLKERFVQ